MTRQTEGWLVVKTEAGNCEILPAEQIASQQQEPVKTWGPYESKSEAIARRVGLIRSGNCNPI